MELVGTLKLKERDVFGVKKCYPHNLLAKQFCDLLKTKTITDEAQAKLKLMGFTVLVARVHSREDDDNDTFC